MRTRDQINRAFARTYNVQGTPVEGAMLESSITFFNAAMEVLLDIRDQNERILQNLKNLDEHMLGVAQRLW